MTIRRWWRWPGDSPGIHSDCDEGSRSVKGVAAGGPCFVVSKEFWPNMKGGHFLHGKGGGGPQGKGNPYAGMKCGKKLFVGGIPQRVDSGAMKAYFLRFGDLSDCVVMKDGAGRPRGFGFVQFKRKEDAARCLQAYGTHVLEGRAVEVKPVDREDQKPEKPAPESPPAGRFRSRSRSSPSIFKNRGKKKSPSPKGNRASSRSSSSSSERKKRKKKSKAGKKSRSSSSRGKRRSRSKSTAAGGKAEKPARSRKSSSSSGSSRGRKRKGRKNKSESRSRSTGRGDKKASTSEAVAENESDEEEVDILAERADQRRANAGALSNIDDLPVKRSPEDLPEPISSWADAVSRRYIDQGIQDKLQAAGLERPTLIQRHALPIISHQCSHYDLIASAQTGSGKTFAFVIPTIAKLLLQGIIPRPFFPGSGAQGSPLVLLLSPTRELAIQTAKEVEVLTKGSNVNSVCVYGGESLKLQQQRLMKAQTDVLCATPGRLVDLIDCSKVSLSFVQCVVLDEADQLMGPGLEVSCAEVLLGRDMPNPESGRQTLLFSATIPQKIREMMPKILREKKIANLTIGHYQDDRGGSCSTIRQIVRWVPDEQQRIMALVQDLQALWIQPGMVTGHRGKVVIFTNRRMQAGQLASNLQRQGMSVGHLHGKLEQQVREEVVEKFRRGQYEVLVATNVASRGLDFPDISLVVQFDMPDGIEVYTHRIGRTGRIGQVGCALAYMGHKDRYLNEKLVEFLTLNGQDVPDFLQLGQNSRSGKASKSSSSGFGGGAYGKSGKDFGKAAWGGGRGCNGGKGHDFAWGGAARGGCVPHFGMGGAGGCGFGGKGAMWGGGKG